MMKLRLGFSNTFENAKRFFTWALKKRYDVIRDDVNPDYVIYGDGNFGRFNRTLFPNSKKIFYTGEPVGRDYAGDDVAITFDHVNSPKHYRLPLYVLEMWSAVHDDKFTNDFFWLKNRGFPDVDSTFDRCKDNNLCSYVQSNPNQIVRTSFVKELIKRNMVDSGGPHLNTVGYVLPREGGHSAKINFIRDRLFNIAFENGARPGYVTEKLLNAFYADVVPVYWGSPTVSRDFNPEAFINAMDYPDSDELIESLKVIGTDKTLYEKIISQPAFRDNVPPSVTNINMFLDWFETFVYEGES